MKSFFSRIWRYFVNSSIFFTKIESYRFRNKCEYKIINKVNTNNSITIHFIHKFNTTNTGDIQCGYYQYCLAYFKNYNCIVHDISSVHFNIIRNNDIVIIGGGGLLNALSEWNYNINVVSKKAKKTIIWSAGFNSNANSKFSVKINFSNISLISIRDYNLYSNIRYVPCATCLLPYFNERYEIVRRIGVVVHHRIKNIPNELRKYPSIDNTTSISDFITFLGQSEIIITNSYHAAYWSTLLGKKCILFSRTTSVKFDYLKYPLVTYSGDLECDISKAICYNNVLLESRQLVYEYIGDILELINN